MHDYCRQEVDRQVDRQSSRIRPGQKGEHVAVAALALVQEAAGP